MGIILAVATAAAIQRCDANEKAAERRAVAAGLANQCMKAPVRIAYTADELEEVRGCMNDKFAMVGKEPATMAETKVAVRDALGVLLVP